MSLVGFKAQNHPQQARRDRVDDRETPQDLFDRLHTRHRFTVDAAASAANAKLPRYWTLETDGLAQSWAGESVWCNPPYSNIGAWVEKAWHAWAEENALEIVMLLPANRTEQRWWQEHVEPFRDREDSSVRVEFLAGRLRFDVPGGYTDPRGNRPPFGVCLITWRRYVQEVPS